MWDLVLAGIRGHGAAVPTDPGTVRRVRATPRACRGPGEGTRCEWVSLWEAASLSRPGSLRSMVWPCPRTVVGVAKPSSDQDPLPELVTGTPRAESRMPASVMRGCLRPSLWLTALITRPGVCVVTRGSDRREASDADETLKSAGGHGPRVRMPPKDRRQLIALPLSRNNAFRCAECPGGTL